jgi:cell division protein FtsQ
MSKAWIKRIIIISSIIVLVVGVVVGHGFRKCAQLEVVIDYDSAAVFITPDEVKAHLISKFGNPVGQRLNQINLQLIENLVQTNAFISEAQASVDLSGKLSIEIKQKKPLVRVQTKNGQQFYLTEEGLMMPISVHGIERTPLASGEIVDFYLSSRNLNKENSEIEDSLLNRSVLFKVWYLAGKIKKDAFMSALTDQIYVNEKLEMELVPRVGGQLIVIGNIDRIENKFIKLKALYSESFNQVGWNKYAIINLKFKNQVVCTRK